MKLPGDIKSIIIFRALQLGDMLCCVPAIRALRQAYPSVNITLASLPWASLFVSRFNRYFDDFIWFPGYPGLPEQPLDLAAFTLFLSNVQNKRFDMALQMQGNGTLVNPMIELFGARLTAGFCQRNDYQPNADYFLEYPNYGSEIERHLALTSFLGIPSAGTDLEFPLMGKDEEDYQSLKLTIECRQYVCVHPGSRGSWRQWPTEHFAALADLCAADGYTVVVTGTEQERDITTRMIAQMEYPVIDLAGKTNLGSMGVLLKNARLLISNCTGVSHMAAALKTPSIVISMDGEPERWAPINKDLHRTIDWLTIPDFGCVLAETKDLLTSDSRHVVG